VIIHQPDGNHIRIPAEIQRRIKALGQDPQHQSALNFIIYALCGRHNRTAITVDGTLSSEVMAWLEGRRYVGETIAQIIEKPIEEDPVPVETRAVTTTERVRRRISKPA
jgi:hypothetical protein